MTVPTLLMILMAGLGRFSWKQTNIRGIHSLNKNILIEKSTKYKVEDEYQGNAKGMQCKCG